ncbi:hypothetical protein LTS08_006037 [Lithohypha guttulata]|nr:hypothetical protein LTS08_006037 [Lithohypha guttulata]
MNPLRQVATRSTRPAFITRIVSRPTASVKQYSTTPRLLATTAQTKGDHNAVHAEHDPHHDSHYDPPGGWLWGLRPGEKAEREGWEIPLYFGCAGYVIAVIAYSMKEDTSIQTWALEEARRRLEAEGILEDPDNKPSSGI